MNYLNDIVNNKIDQEQQFAEDHMRFKNYVRGGVEITKMYVNNALREFIPAALKLHLPFNKANCIRHIKNGHWWKLGNNIFIDKKGNFFRCKLGMGRAKKISQEDAARLIAEHIFGGYQNTEVDCGEVGTYDADRRVKAYFSSILDVNYQKY